jgi:hypothetical protein
MKDNKNEEIKQEYDDLFQKAQEYLIQNSEEQDNKPNNELKYAEKEKYNIVDNYLKKIFVQNLSYLMKETNIKNRESLVNLIQERTGLTYKLYFVNQLITTKKFAPTHFLVAVSKTFNVELTWLLKENKDGEEIEYTTNKNIFDLSKDEKEILLTIRKFNKKERQFIEHSLKLTALMQESDDDEVETMKALRRSFPI